MGSSKKHKEKDKDKDRERRRDKDRKHRDKDKDRDREAEKDKSSRRREERNKEKRSHGSEEDVDRVEKKKAKREEYDDLYEYAVEESAREDRNNSYDTPQHQQESGEASLSIEETNKLRIKLGLKPLEVPDSSEDKGNATSLKEDIHVPAVNMSDQKETEKFKRKLEEMREKRRINKKLGKVKSLGAGDSDDDGDSAMSWINKSRKLEREKLLPEKRAQLLAEMDEEFGVSDLVEEEFGSVSRPRQPAYSSQDLRGLKVEHSQEHFTEGSSVIMTLKDASVLDEDEQTLINVNIVDKEKGNKNIELRKRKPDYRPYDESELDEYGMVKQRGLLEKYDEEIEGEQKKSFVLARVGMRIDCETISGLGEQGGSSEIAINSKEHEEKFQGTTVIYSHRVHPHTKPNGPDA